MDKKHIINPWKEVEGYDCFGCSPDNPIGLHMDFTEEGEDIVCHWHPQAHFQGWVNTMHGGILSTLCDETAGWVVFRKLQTSGVTTELNVRYKKPVMTTDDTITIRGHVIGQKRNLVTIGVTSASPARPPITPSRPRRLARWASPIAGWKGNKPRPIPFPFREYIIM